MNICTCDYWQGHTKVYFTASGVVSADGDGVLKQSTADPQRCAERCRGASGCFSAFFRYWTGECFLISASTTCSSRISTWVGSSTSQGGVTFLKYLPPPPSSPPPIPSSPPPSPPTSLLADSCSPSNPICVLRDDTGCPSGCSTHAAHSTRPSYTGGSTCGGGVNICTCDYWQGHTKVYFTASGVVSADGDGVLKQSTADPQRCAEHCRVTTACSHAMFRFSSGECYLVTGATACTKRISTWVGSSANQGGITFQRYQPPPPPAAPPPPRAPPSWPPHSLLVDPGEDAWPPEWFGNVSSVQYDKVRPAAWLGEPGVRPGFDFGLPNSTVASPKGLLTLRRSFDELPNPPTTAASLPSLSFSATAVFCMWVPWKLLEPSQGVYNFAALHANIEATAASGWKFALRMLTARVVDAPSYLSGLGITKIDGGLNYDPAHATYHARYLALLQAIRDHGVCQNETVAMMYAGYASTSYGDEYIGPHPAGYSGDPAMDYTHVKERLDGWADTCAGGNVRKILMGGGSAYGTRLGFGTRNGTSSARSNSERSPASIISTYAPRHHHVFAFAGFVEHCMASPSKSKPCSFECISLSDARPHNCYACGIRRLV